MKKFLTVFKFLYGKLKTNKVSGDFDLWFDFVNFELTRTAENKETDYVVISKTEYESLIRDRRTLYNLRKRYNIRKI